MLFHLLALSPAYSKLGKIIADLGQYCVSKWALISSLLLFSQGCFLFL